MILANPHSDPRYQLRSPQESALAAVGFPVRRIGRGHRSVRGRAVVHGHLVAFESTLERDFLETVDFDRTVVSILEQPCRISYRDRNGRQRSYVPDALVQHRPGTGLHGIDGFLYEIKHRDDLFAAWSTLKPKFMAARAWARERRLRFVILTEREIRGSHLDNVRVLNQYRHLQPHPEIEERLAALLVVLGEISVRTLVEAIWSCEEQRIAAPAYVLRMIAAGRINLSDLAESLTMESLVWIEAGVGFTCCPYSYRLNRA